MLTFTIEGKVQDFIYLKIFRAGTDDSRCGGGFPMRAANRGVLNILSF